MLLFPPDHTTFGQERKKSRLKQKAVAVIFSIYE